MDYEKNKEALVIVKQMVADKQISQEVAEKYFPELKESEDERIRKEIISMSNTLGRKDWIAWLEKQGEHKKFRDSIQVGDKVTRNEDGVLVNLSQLKRVAKKDEKQGEQEPVNKYEPMSLDEAIEHCKEKSCGNNACSLEHKQLGKWLTELKELKEQNPAWSEEDEHMFNTIANSLNIEKVERVWHTTEKEVDNWLKSLKDRYTWKPSEEQMKLIKDIVFKDRQKITRKELAIFHSIYNDLKKLK